MELHRLKGIPAGILQHSSRFRAACRSARVRSSREPTIRIWPERELPKRGRTLQRLGTSVPQYVGPQDFVKTLEVRLEMSGGWTAAASEAEHRFSFCGRGRPKSTRRRASLAAAVHIPCTRQFESQPNRDRGLPGDRVADYSFRQQLSSSTCKSQFMQAFP
jgi:hypothetical protein